MKLTDLLKEENIIADITSRDKSGVLHELVKGFAEQTEDLGEEEFFEVLSEREKLGSTGIGNGVAIPHGKLKHLSRHLISFGRSRDGIEFDSIDGKPASLFFVLVAPENSSGEHLKILAKISKMLKNKDFRSRLIKAEDREEIHRVISDFDQEF